MTAFGNAHITFDHDAGSGSEPNVPGDRLPGLKRTNDLQRLRVARMRSTGWGASPGCPVSDLLSSVARVLLAWLLQEYVPTLVDAGFSRRPATIDLFKGTAMKTTQRRNLRACALFLALASPAALALDLFYEPFNIPSDTCPPGGAGGPGTYPFPTGWLLFNIDGRVPDANVAYVNDAWEDREDFAHDVSQCAAFSTSYYAPPGQADDWMWSPPVTLTAGASLSWRAIAYDPAFADGYEVRIKTGAAPTPANQATSDVVLTIPAEQGAWTAHALDVSSYGGQTVYIGFRNNSNDKFLLLVDDVRVVDNAPDVAAIASMAFASEYARAPLGMDIVPDALGVNALNAGGVALTNVTGTATEKVDGVAAGLPMPADAPIAVLAIGANQALAFGTPAAFSGAGAWSVEYAVSADQTNESDLLNNVVSVPGTTIGGNEFARWEGDATGSIGIGAGNGGELGVALTLPSDLLVGGANFAMLAIPPESGEPPAPNICPGFDYVVNLREFDTVNNVPGALIDTTVPVPCHFDEGGSYDVPFVGGRHLLTAGTYVLTAVEPVAGMTVPLPLHNQRYLPGTTWVNWPTNPFGHWAHFEDFGAGFAKTPQLSLLAAEASIFIDGFDGVAPVRAPMQVSRKVAPEVVRGRPTRNIAPTRLVPSLAH
jgi:hypothetical protein